MGTSHSFWYSSSKRKIIVIGLSDTGKTSSFHIIIIQNFVAFVKLLETGKFDGTIKPTQSLTITNIRYKKLKLIFFDLAGSQEQRIFWRNYYQGAQGVIFFVDGTNAKQFPIAAKELENVVKEVDLFGVPIAIFVNKIEMVKGLSLQSSYYYRQLNLDELIKLNGKMQVFQGSLINRGDGIVSLLEWLADNMESI